MIIELDMYQTLAIAVVVLMLGKFLRKKCSLLEKFCIPAPVVGVALQKNKKQIENRTEK